jgi:predicted nucleic acid-binding protein
MSPSTLFNGSLVVVDAMVIINFHGLLVLDNLITWAKGEVVIEKRIKNEAQFSMAGPIDLTSYIQKGLIIEEELTGKEEEDLFYYYVSNKLGGAIIHAAEAACLALAISKRYGLACDEKVVRDEFKKKCPNQICIHSWGIVDKAKDLGFIGEQEARDLKKGLYYV